LKKKQSYRISNWKEDNKALVNRGSITFWFDEQSIEQWHATEMNRFKTIFGNKLNSRLLENQSIEALIRCCALNKRALSTSYHQADGVPDGASCVSAYPHLYNLLTTT
jgi:hypothetical protein